MTPDAHDSKEPTASNLASFPIKPSVPRGRKLVLVDFENVPNVSLDGIDAATEVVVFIGAAQKTVPIALVLAVKKLGEQLQLREVGGSGKNALDFFIAYELGKALAEDRSTQCIIVSNDTGFDPLIKQLNNTGLSCSRTANPSNQAPRSSAAPKTKTDVSAADLELILSMLRKSAKNRPAKRSTLKNHISAQFQNKKSDKDVELIITQLESDGCIELAGDKVAYKL